MGTHRELGGGKLERIRLGRETHWSVATPLHVLCCPAEPISAAAHNRESAGHPSRAPSSPSRGPAPRRSGHVLSPTGPTKSVPWSGVVGLASLSRQGHRALGTAGGRRAHVPAGNSAYTKRKLAVRAQPARSRQQSAPILQRRHRAQQPARPGRSVGPAGPGPDRHTRTGPLSACRSRRWAWQRVRVVQARARPPPAGLVYRGTLRVDVRRVRCAACAAWAQAALDALALTPRPARRSGHAIPPRLPAWKALESSSASAEGAGIVDGVPTGGPGVGTPSHREGSGPSRGSGTLEAAIRRHTTTRKRDSESTAGRRARPGPLAVSGPRGLRERGA
jgi:hypothetical protein